MYIRTPSETEACARVRRRNENFRSLRCCGGSVTDQVEAFGHPLQRVPALLALQRQNPSAQVPAQQKPPAGKRRPPSLDGLGAVRLILPGDVIVGGEVGLDVRHPVDVEHVGGSGVRSRARDAVLVLLQPLRRFGAGAGLITVIRNACSRCSRSSGQLVVPGAGLKEVHVRRLRDLKPTEENRNRSQELVVSSHSVRKDNRFHGNGTFNRMNTNI